MDKNILTRPPDAGARYPQVRAMPRYRLVAQADIYEPLSRTRLQARTTEIGANGCYVDVTNPFARNTVVELRILWNHSEFRTWARVAYVREDFGMGLTFLGTLAKQSQTIADWIRELETPAPR